MVCPWQSVQSGANQLACLPSELSAPGMRMSSLSGPSAQCQITDRSLSQLRQSWSTSFSVGAYGVVGSEKNSIFWHLMHLKAPSVGGVLQGDLVAAVMVARCRFLSPRLNPVSIPSSMTALVSWCIPHRLHNQIAPQLVYPPGSAMAVRVPHRVHSRLAAPSMCL